MLTGNHLRLVVKQGDGPILNGIAFGRRDDFLDVTTSKDFSVCYTVEENKWKGEVRLQLMVKDLGF